MKELPWRTIVVASAFATVAGFGSHVDAARAMNSCRATAAAAQRSCRAGAQSEKWLALGKCTSLPNSTAKKRCDQQAAADAADALKGCKEQDGLRRPVCKRLGPAPYVPVIDPANFTHSTTIDNPYFPLPPGMTFIYEGTVTEDPGGARRDRHRPRAQAHRDGPLHRHVRHPAQSLRADRDGRVRRVPDPVFRGRA